jgi:hypothetical protein
VAHLTRISAQFIPIIPKHTDIKTHVSAARKIIAFYLIIMFTKLAQYILVKVPQVLRVV